MESVRVFYEPNRIELKRSKVYDKLMRVSAFGAEGPFMCKKQRLKQTYFFKPGLSGFWNMYLSLHAIIMVIYALK
jgi:hypothetical protein